MSSGLGVAGSKPPTALVSRSGTGARTGTKGKSVNELKAALTETLVKKMREKFAEKATDVAAQDIIGAEVVSFMSATGSVKEEDISALEARIEAKLSGKQSAFAGVKDEWAVITKYEAEQNEVHQKKYREMIKARQKQMKSELDQQVQESKLRALKETEEEQKYFEMEQKELERWKEEEKSKMETKINSMFKLKQERDAQLCDQAERRAKMMQEKKKEEDDTRLMLAMEQKRKMQENERKVQKNKSDMQALIDSNEESKRIQEAVKEKEKAEEVKFQLEYAAKLQQQEADRERYLEEMKRKQAIQEAAGAARGAYKRWMDEKIIEKNFAEREAQLDKREEASFKKIELGNLEMRRVLAEQLKEKQTRKLTDAEKEAQRVAKFNAGLEAIEQREAEWKERTAAKQARHRQELDAQIKDNQERKKVVLMSDTERKLNHNLLKKIESTTLK